MAGAIGPFDWRVNGCAKLVTSPPDRPSTPSGGVARLPGMDKLPALVMVAFADVARTAWVLDALGSGPDASLREPSLGAGLVLATGGLSLAMIGLAMRAVLTVPAGRR